MRQIIIHECTKIGTLVPKMRITSEIAFFGNPTANLCSPVESHTIERAERAQNTIHHLRLNQTTTTFN